MNYDSGELNFIQNLKFIHAYTRCINFREFQGNLEEVFEKSATKFQKFLRLLNILKLAK